MRADELRSASAAVDGDIRGLSTTMQGSDAVAAVQRLMKDWAHLTTLMDIPPARAMRQCPKCGGTGFAEATRCGDCWTVLQPV